MNKLETSLSQNDLNSLFSTKVEKASNNYFYIMTKTHKIYIKNPQITWDQPYTEPDGATIKYVDTTETVIAPTSTTRTTPITNPKDYDYPIEKIDEDFTTFGKDVKELVSAQFVIKVLETLATKECQLHVNGEIIQIKPKNEPVYIEKSPAMQEPTLNQVDYIKALCDFYDCNVPDVKTVGQASRWLSNFLKTHDYKTDKRKAELRQRYQKIFDDHASGMTMEQLIEKYQLTKPTIRKAIKAIQNNTV